MRLLIALGLLLVAVAAVLLLRGAPSSSSSSSSEPAGQHPDSTRLAFPGATGWREEAACTDVDAKDACAGEWTGAGGQKVRVLLLPVGDPARLATMTQKLQTNVQAQGGVVGEFATKDGKVVRLLQPVVRAEDDVDLVNISYLLVSPDRRLLHIVTSLVTQQEQVDADQRVRDLLAFAAWVDGQG